MRSAVLLVVFNRPELTRQVFDAIRAARPPRLYVAADGPRAGREGEADRCQQVRQIATAVDWPCELHTLFRDANLGCKMAVSGGIDWFFGVEEEGIVLEDDVLPLGCFFDYCDELLERFRDETRVGMISGNNLVSAHATPATSYVFSRNPHVWGWASWRRAWKHFDVHMRGWKVWRDRGGMDCIAAGDWRFRQYWQRRLELTSRGQIDTWDYQWVFSQWQAGMLSVTPASNLTHNLGFGADATHTQAEIPACVRDSVPRPLGFPLMHPSSVERDVAFDRLVDIHVAELTSGWEFKQRVGNVPVIGPGLRLLQQVMQKR